MATQTGTMIALSSISQPNSENVVALHETQKGTRVSSLERRLGNVSTEAGHEVQNNKSPRDLHGIIWVLVVVAVLWADFLVALDNTIVADVQPKILLDLGEIDKLPWVSVAFALGGVAVNLVWGKSFGQFDTKVLFMTTVLIFEIGSAICGSAPNMNALIVGRAICGVGGSGIYLGAVNILSGLTTQAERSMYLGFAGLTWGAGTVLGPIIGGAFADSNATWRWSFYINLCIGGTVAPVYFLLLPSSDPHPGIPVSTRIKSIDFTGAILIIGAFVSLVMVVAFGGAIYDWNSGQVIGLFVCAFVLWSVFILQQTFCIFTNPTDRLFLVQFVSNWELDALFAQSAASMTAAFIPI
ncbi:hypothetical protein MMC17_009785 [Xylographa soralifera]|nr:hypothetical protein [Xylographa soralifera]